MNLYEELGIDFNSLGCLMVDVDLDINLTNLLDPGLAYVDDTKHWVDGIVNDYHCTVRFGFLPQVKRHHVDYVLGDVDLNDLEMRLMCLSKFGTPGMPYEAIVIRCASPGLIELNNKLGALPNIQTFPYKPHITIANMQAGWWDNHQKEIAQFNASIGQKIKPTRLNYGDNL